MNTADNGSTTTFVADPTTATLPLAHNITVGCREFGIELQGYGEAARLSVWLDGKPLVVAQPIGEQPYHQSFSIDTLGGFSTFRVLMADDVGGFDTGTLQLGCVVASSTTSPVPAVVVVTTAGTAAAPATTSAATFASARELPATGSSLAVPLAGGGLLLVVGIVLARLRRAV